MLEPKMFGRYRLDERVGAGGMGEVWRATRIDIGGAEKTVALKRIIGAEARNPTFRELFFGEARLAMALSHSNIVQVFEFDEHEGELYMAMEWVEGRDLNQLCGELRAHELRVPVVVAAHILAQILRALAYAHDAPSKDGRVCVIHRDISPHNVMLSESGEVKLMDFGVARLAHEKTAGQFVKGKLRYMPPEQFMGYSASPSVDLFAAGAVFHELLDGAEFRGEARGQEHLVGLISEREVPGLIDGDRLDLELDRLRVGLLEPDPSARLPSARAALEVLRSWPGFRDTSMELESIVRYGASAPELERGPAVSQTIKLDVDLNSTERMSPNWSTRVDRAPGGVKKTRRGSRSPPASVLFALGLMALPGALALYFVVTRPEHAGADLVETKPEADEHVETATSEQVELPTSQRPEGESGGLAEDPGGVEDATIAGEDPSFADESTAEEELVLEERVERVVGDPAAGGRKPRARRDDSAGGGQSQVAVNEVPPPPIETRSEPRSRPRRRAPPKPASVKFFAGELFFAFVEIGGDELTLEPDDKTSLKPGRHRVRVRRSTDEEWKVAGTIEVEAGQRYVVHMRRPHGLEIESR